jgi:tape measure domain-containing protein
MANNLEYTLRLKDLFSKTMQGAANQVKGLDGKMGALKKGISGVGSMIAGAFAVGAVISFGKAVLESLKNYETFHASIKVLLYGNEKAAKALESQLITLAKTTPFSLVDVQASTKQLMAYGFKAGDVVDTIRTLGDISSGTGNDIKDVVYLYGTLKTSGRVALTDVNQFANRGIPIWESLAKNMKLTTKEVREFVGQGKVGFKDVENAFKSMTEEGGQFFGMMDAQSKTVGGQLSMMGDSWEQLKVKIGQSQTGIIAGTTSWINNLLEGINRGIDAMNLLDKAFEKNNKLQYNFFEKYVGKSYDKYFGMFGADPRKGGQAEMEQYAGQTKEQYVDSSKDRATALRNQISLNVMMKMLTLDKKMESLEKNRRIAILNELKNKNLDNLALFGMKENKGLATEGAGGVDGGKGAKSLGTGSEVTGQRPQAINININKLVEELNIQTTNLTEGAGRMKELVSKALLEAVNDINLIAMA